MTTTTSDITRPFHSFSDRTNDILMSVIIGVFLTTLSYLVALWAGWVEGMNWLEVFAVFTSYASTWLCVKERRFNYIFGAISTAAYAYLFYTFDLLASAGLNAYLALALIYGWIRWRRDSDTKPVEHVKMKWVPVYMAVTILAWLGGVAVIQALGGSLAPFDVGILALTILAQLLLDNKKIETWIIWAVVNVLAIYVYFSSGLMLVGFQYIFFLANTVYGYLVWRKSMLASRTPEPVATRVGA